MKEAEKNEVAGSCVLLLAGIAAVVVVVDSFTCPAFSAEEATYPPAVAGGLYALLLAAVLQGSFEPLARIAVVTKPELLLVRRY